jgi:4-hydroxybenzoate polyprenyltransferase
VGLSILLQLNTTAQVLGASSLVLVGAYPAMKRITWWPQAFLGEGETAGRGPFS